MTQQQKIAAALARAGTSHSTAWVHEPAGVAVEAGDPDPREDQTIPIPEIHPAQLKPLARFAYISLLLIWSGLALAILSCYLLVTIR